MLLKLTLLSVIFVISECQIRGGRYNLDLREPSLYDDVKELANFAIEQIANERRHRQSADRADLQLIRIVEAHRQVVSGLNTWIKLRVKNSKCKTECSIEICDVMVYVRHDGTKELKSQHCVANKPRSYALVGSFKDISVDDQRVHDVVEFAVRDINLRSNNDHYQRLYHTSSARVQTVNGYNYIVEFLLTKTDCNVNEGINDPNNCGELQHKWRCTAAIHESFAQKTYTRTRTNCVSVE